MLKKFGILYVTVDYVKFYCKLRFYLDRFLFFLVDVTPFLFIHFYCVKMVGIN